MDFPRSLVVMLSIIGIAGSSSLPVLAQPQAGKPSFEQVKAVTLESLARTNPASGKTFLSEWAEDNIVRESAMRKGPSYLYDLRICQDAGYWFGVDYRTRYDLYKASTLLAQIKMYEYFLDRLGIPSSVLSPTLAKLEALARKDYASNGAKPPESIAFDEQKDSLLDDLASRLNEYLASKGQPPRFAVVGMCGAGESYVQVKLVPPGPARVAYIPAMHWKLCQAQGVDPYNPAKCPNWRNLTANGEVTEFFSGLYYFDVKWRNGKDRFRGPYQLKPAEKVISISPNND
jgi:hypothetical protein